MRLYIADMSRLTAAPTKRLTPKELTAILRGLPLNGYPNRVRFAVVIANTSQNALAADTGLHLSAVSQIVRGQKVPNADQQAGIAKFFGVPVDVLFPLQAELVTR